MKNNRFVAAVLIPGFLFLILFSVFPVAYGLGISFYDYNPANSQNPFIGLENYRRLIHDEVFWLAVKNTIVYCLAAVTANIVITLFLAELISVLPSKWMKTMFRTILFIPCIAPMVGTSTVWKYGILGTDGGLLNKIAGIFGIAPKNWFLTTWQMLLLIIIFTLWADIGYNVVLFTAGLEGVPREFDEAAAIDGAGPVKRFLWIKLPLIGRTFAFVAIMTMANYFQMFAQFRVFAANGGRNNTAMVLTNYVFKMSFDSFDMGYASAVAAALFVLLLATMMVPPQVTMIPRYLMIQKMHLFNTRWALIVPGLVSAFSIYLARQFIGDIPDSLCEAAKIDGAGPIRIYWHVILPNIKPAIGSIGIFTAMMHWNDYLNPLLMLNDMEKMTLPLGLVIFDSQRSSDLSATMAAASMIMIPMIVIFLIFQKQFIKGMTMSGIK